MRVDDVTGNGQAEFARGVIGCHWIQLRGHRMRSIDDMVGDNWFCPCLVSVCRRRRRPRRRLLALGAYTRSFLNSPQAPFVVYFAQNLSESPQKLRVKTGVSAEINGF
jgi:hypothetical protein